MTIESTTRPRIRRTAEEAMALVADWRASGQSKAEFCRTRAILRSTLTSCLVRVEASLSEAPGFIEVRRGGDGVAGALTLEIDGALRLIGLDVATALSVVSALRAVGR